MSNWAHSKSGLIVPVDHVLDGDEVAKRSIGALAEELDRVSKEHRERGQTIAQLQELLRRERAEGTAARLRAEIDKQRRSIERLKGER